MHKGRRKIIKERLSALTSDSFALNGDVDELMGDEEASKGIFLVTWSYN